MASRSTFIVCLVILWAVGCGGCGAGSNSDPPEVAVNEVPVQPEDEVEPVDPGPAPEVQVTGEVDPDSRQVTLRIDNHGDTAELFSAVTFERLSGDSFSRLDGVQVSLRYDCQARAPACVSLIRGASLLPPPWLAKAGEAQCSCSDCEDVPAGTYRAVIESCNRAHRVESDPFVIP